MKMIKRLGPLPYKERLRELRLFCLENRMLRDLTNVYKHLKGGCKEYAIRLSSLVPSDRIGHSEHKLKHRRHFMKIRKHSFTMTVTEHWHRFPGRW